MNTTTITQLFIHLLSNYQVPSAFLFARTMQVKKMDTILARAVMKYLFSLSPYAIVLYTAHPEITVLFKILSL